MLRRLHSRAQREDDRGAAALEFALVVVPLMWVVIGIVNFGFLLSDQIALNNGARQAVRLAVVPGNDCTVIQAEAEQASRSLGTAPVTTDVFPGCGGADGPCAGTPDGTDIRVELTKQTNWVVPYMPPFVGAGPELSAEGVMRCEFS